MARCSPFGELREDRAYEVIKSVIETVMISLVSGLFPPEWTDLVDIDETGPAGR